jgi:twitching motility protein PilT
LLKRQGGGRVAAHEILVATSAVRNLIREAKVAQIYSAIQTGGNLGMQTMDAALAKLITDNTVARDEAQAKAKGVLA